MTSELQFTASAQSANHHWGLILSGGDGKRLQHFLRTELGLDRPKQYCTIFGNQSMLRHTIERASAVIPKSQLLTVINSEHQAFAAEDLADREAETIIKQPLNRETAPGILLPLLHIYQRDPQAIVALFPTDHFIVEENLFMDHVRTAFTFAERVPEYLVTLGVTPNSLQPGYGWIEKGDLMSKEEEMSLYGINVFWEKPGKELTEHLYAKGCLWNTLTLVGSVELFIQLYREYVPEIFRAFERIQSVLGTEREAAAAHAVFQALPCVNFSHAILERIPHRLGVLPVKGVYWSDWGDESRIREDLASAERYIRAHLEKSRLVLAKPAPQVLNLFTPESIHAEPVSSEPVNV